MAKRIGATALLVASAAACDLEVLNENQPDIGRVFSTPAAIAQTIGTGYQSVHNALATNNLMPQLLTISLESYSGLNNFQMGPRTGIPRSPVQNATGAPSIFADFSSLARGGRLAVNALNALDALIAEDKTPADGILGSPAIDMRTRSFAFFVIGAHQGWMAIVYDSAGIVRDRMESIVVPPLSGAHDVMDAAIEMLDSAIVIAETPAAAAGFPVPASWLGNASGHTTKDQYVRLLKSYRARFRAGVARTPEERDAVDWTSVLADATAGIQTDFMVNSGGATGWNIGFIGALMFQDGRAWSQMSLMYYGMADTARLGDGTPTYQAWLATPLSSRSPFLVRTPDRRWPRGETRAAQVANSSNPADHTSRPYISASIEDEIADPWGWSYYQFNRTRYIREAYNTGPNEGPWPEMVKAEIDMLAAEAHLRLGNVAQAITLINVYRTANDLPSLTGLTSKDSPVPGADYATSPTGGFTVTPNPAKTNCVPRVPLPGGGTACGSVWEAMKYEKRMETAFTSYARWWIDGRGWGDLITNTHTQYPVPYQEMNARQLTPYPLGGGGASSAPTGTYGF